MWNFRRPGGIKIRLLQGSGILQTDQTSLFFGQSHYCTVYPWSCIFCLQSFHIHCSLCSCYFVSFLTKVSSNNFFKTCSTTKTLCSCFICLFKQPCLVSFRLATFSSPWTRLSTVREASPNNSKQTTIFCGRRQIRSFCFCFAVLLNTETQLRKHLIGWILLDSCHMNTT